MSSKGNHINITRENYEEYFLLYIDNELAVDERKAVEAFVLLHPDLREELDLLEGTRLDADLLSFPEKDALLSHRLGAETIDESLLLYIDNELDNNNKKRVELEIRNNRNFRKQFEQLKAVKLDPSEKIICDFKSELYRNETSRKPLAWMRVAAIALLVIGAGSLVILNNNKGDVQPTVATTTDNTGNPGTKPKETITEIVEPQKQILATDNSVKKNFTKATEVKDQPVQIDQPDNNTPPDNLIASNSITDNSTLTVVDPREKTTAIIGGGSQEIINTDPVTKLIPSPYNSIAGPTSVNNTDVANSDGKQGSVRGLLRKATRFIERRTGINPVNEDDKLLVGMVAISLK
jgi:hypothetical protein